MIMKLETFFWKEQFTKKKKRNFCHIYSPFQTGKLTLRLVCYLFCETQKDNLAFTFFLNIFGVFTVLQLKWHEGE